MLSCFNFFSCKKVPEQTIYYNIKEEIALYDTIDFNLLDGIEGSEVNVVSSNDKVLKVKGLSVFAVSTGNAKITVTYGEKRQEQYVKVYKSDMELQIDKSDMPLLLGQVYLPSNKFLTFSMSTNYNML